VCVNSFSFLTSHSVLHFCSEFHFILLCLSSFFRSSVIADFLSVSDIAFEPLITATLAINILDIIAEGDRGI
jgi:hypothetical protein